MPPPARAVRRRRPWFHPRRGWLRRLERSVSRWLGARVYPHVPGIALPYGYLLRRDLTLSEAEVDLSDLPAAFDGLRILVVSDVHVGPFVSPAVIGETFARLLALRPDLILLPGDMISSRTEEIGPFASAFRALAAPLGVYAVLGNHDHYGGDPARVREILAGLGTRVLHNESIRLNRGGAALSLAGVDDLLLGSPDLQAALAGTEPPVVLLSHNPDMLFRAARRKVALVLSGHTHGGQIRVPGLPVLVRQSRYRLDEGRYRAGDTELIVSRGLGAVALPWRAGCPPEAVLLRLRSRK
jgi:predicted MPP superfamily phosphohydrolase